MTHQSAWMRRWLMFSSGNRAELHPVVRNEQFGARGSHRPKMSQEKKGMPAEPTTWEWECDLKWEWNLANGIFHGCWYAKAIKSTLEFQSADIQAFTFPRTWRHRMVGCWLENDLRTVVLCFILAFSFMFNLVLYQHVSTISQHFGGHFLALLNWALAGFWSVMLGHNRYDGDS